MHPGGRMDLTDDRRDARRLLAGLENGGMSAHDSFLIAERLDPVLVYAVVRYLRDVYPASDPAARSVLDRVVALMSKHAAVVVKFKTGGEDAVSRWFETEYSFRAFKGRADEMFEILAEKIES
jgi:hypothetical protein